MMEDRILRVSAPSLPTLYAHYRSSSIATVACSAGCICCLLFQVKFPVMVQWMQTPSLCGADHEVWSFIPPTSIIRYCTRLGIEMTPLYLVSNT